SLIRLRRLATIANFPFATLVCAEQMHGTSIAILGEDFRVDPVRSAGTHDGLMSTTPGLGVVVWTADCVPVLLHGGPAVSAVHAGWRGAVAGILPQALEIFRNLHGVIPSELSATIGPAIGSCHYPVGPEVITALDRWAVSDSSWRQDNRIDLRLFLRRQLLDLGLPESAVEVVGPCTACDPRLASFRRDGSEAGRQISIIGRTGDRLGR
ncbi:MAG: polyphenol oxidase family protein, partial [Acidobacteriota bacterium]